MLLFRVDRDYFTSLGDIIIEFFIKYVPGKGGSVSQDHQFHTGTGDRYVHAPQVVQEAYLSIQSFTKFLESQLHDSRRKLYLSAPFFFYLRYG